MNTDWIRSFVAVAETGSFSEAAFALYQSQSVISKHVRKLEQDLQVQLFTREHRRADLTPAGHAVLPEARLLLQQLERLERTARPDARLQIALLPVANDYAFTDALSAFSEQHKEIRLLLDEHSNAVIHELLRTDQVDGAFYRLNMDEAVPPHAIICCREDLVLLAAQDRLPASETPVSLRDLRNEPFILLDRNTCLYDASLQLCLREGFHPHIIYTGSSGRNIARLVEKGQGIAILARHAAEGVAGTSLRILSIDSDLRSTVVFAPSETGLHKPGMPALLEFIHRASSTFQ